MIKIRKKAAALLGIAALLTGMTVSVTAAPAVGDMLVGPERKATGTDSAEENGDGPLFQETVGTRDLDALWSFIQNRENTFREQQSEKMEKAGIPVTDQNFLYEDGFEEMSKQILAMTAVCREYTFYNRIVCQWYADNLWDETYTYEVVGTKYQKKAIEQLLPMSGAAAEFLGLSGGGLSNAIEHVGSTLEDECKVTVILKNRSREEIYDMDYYRFQIPVEWDGWTEKNRAECDALMALDDGAFREELEKRQAESLLYSPLPLYKQGAAEWGAESFGNGTLASDACCPTAIAMVLSYLKGERITPSKVSEQYDQDAYRSREQGSYGGKMCAAAAADYGVLVEAGTAPLSGDEIVNALGDGAKIVMSMRPGDGAGRYATVYHYVALAGLTEDGKVIVNNPGINTNVTYDDIETILANQSGRGYGIFRAW